MRWGNNSVGLPVGVRRRAAVRPSLVARVVRAVDRFITRLQEWLETDDAAGQKVVAYSVLAMAWVMLLSKIVGWMLR